VGVEQPGFERLGERAMWEMRSLEETDMTWLSRRQWEMSAVGTWVS
jgi:hypothetical protein